MAEIKHLNPEVVNKSIPELSVESKLLYERLRSLTVDECVSYQELGGLIGRNVQEEGRCNLGTAIRKCLSEDRIHIACIRTIGVKRIRDDAVVTGGDALARIARLGNKRRRSLHAVSYDDLPKNLQVAHNTELSQLGVIRHFTTSATARKISSHVEKSELPVGKTLEFFHKS